MIANAQSTRKQYLASGILESLTEDRLVLSIPGTDYRLHLVPAVPSAAFPPVGQRIKGTIHAEALRIHTAGAGGGFIEPVYGVPRIIAGRVLDFDAEKHQVIVHAGVPMVITTLPEQRFDILAIGSMVNFYVKSGATFTPAE